MARILYAVNGEGFGHAIRSTVGIDHLRKKHDVTVLAGGRPYTYFKRLYGKDVVRITAFNIVYRNNRFCRRGSLLELIKRLPQAFRSLVQVVKLFRRERPDIVISDFEPTAAYAAYLTRTPVLSIDNQAILPKTRVDTPGEHLLFWFWFSVGESFFVPFATTFIVTTFFYPDPKHQNVVLVPCILRDPLLLLTPKQGDYFLVYQTSDSNRKMLETMKHLDERFVVYGFNKEGTDGSLTFKRFDEKVFFGDLAGCKAVITNGGFSLIGEALYLKKPVLSIPVLKQGEQIINAHYVEKLGFGSFQKVFTEEGFAEFTAKLPRYTKNLAAYTQKGNTLFFTHLDTALKDTLKRREKNYKP